MAKTSDFIVLSGKGGVGKSMLARAVLHYLQVRGRPVLAFDGDGSNSSLTRFYPQTSMLEVDGDLRVMHWFESAVVPPLLSGQAQAVVLDLGAGGERLFRTWCQANAVEAVLQAEGVRLQLWHVLDPSLDALTPVLDGVAALPASRHTLWLNLGLARGLATWEPARAFDALRAEPEFKELVRQHRGLDIPPLLEAGRLDELDMAFSEAASTDSPLTLFERLRVQRWLTSVGTAIEQALASPPGAAHVGAG